MYTMQTFQLLDKCWACLGLPQLIDTTQKNYSN